MNNWSDYERYLKPVHLKGQAVTLTIVKAVEEETHPQKGKSVMSPILYFRELPFGLILSPTNRQTLIALYGDRVADSLGKPITVQAVTVKVAGNDKQPIRILKQRPAAPHVEPSTGEIVDAPSPSAAAGADTVPAVEGEGPSELDEFFGTPKLTATSTPQPERRSYRVATVKFNGMTATEWHTRADQFAASHPHWQSDGAASLQHILISAGAAGFETITGANLDEVFAAIVAAHEAKAA